MYALCMGLGYGLCYYLPLVCAWSYFPENKDKISGLILGFYSLGAVSFALYGTEIVNPDNDSATIVVQTGATTESFYPTDSE